MPVTEVGCMAVKPGIDIMDDSTPEGQILPKAWKAVLAAPGGPSRIYWSLASDDPLQSWAFFDFNSIEEHENFSKSFGGEATKDMPKIYNPPGHAEFTNHVDVTPTPPSVLLSPVTEVVMVYFSSDISADEKEKVTARLKQFMEERRKAVASIDAIGSGWGLENDFPIRGGEDGQVGSVFFMFFGWNSVDAQNKAQDAGNGEKDVAQLVEGIVKVASFNLSCRSLGRE